MSQQIIKTSTKQEPSAGKTVFGDSGTPEGYKDFDYSALENRADINREAMARGDDVEKVIAGFVKIELSAHLQEALLRFVNLVINADNPKLELEVIIAASDLPIRNGMSHN